MEAHLLCKSQLNSDDYVVSSTFRKVFDISSQNIMDNCLPTEQVIAILKHIFGRGAGGNSLTKTNAHYVLCRTFSDNASKEPVSL